MCMRYDNADPRDRLLLQDLNVAAVTAVIEEFVKVFDRPPPDSRSLRWRGRRGHARC